MAKYPRFSDYIESKKTAPLMDEKEGLAGEDYDGPLSQKPPQEPTRGYKGKPNPYKNVDPDDVPNVVWTAPDKDVKKGLAYDQSPGMTPKTVVTPDGKTPEADVRSPKFKKLTSEEFIKTTKEMTPEEFAKFILDESHIPNNELTTVTDLYGNEFTPDPMQSIQYVAGLLLANSRMMQRFVRELKRREGLEMLIGEVMEHPETYDNLTTMFGEDGMGKERCSRMAKSLHNNYVSLLDGVELAENVNEVVSPGVGPMFAPGKSKPMAPSGGGTPSSGGGGDFGGGGSGNDANVPAWGSRQGGGGKEGGGGANMGSGPANGPAGAGGVAPNFGGGPLQSPGQKKQANLSYMKENAAENLIGEMAAYEPHRSFMLKHCKDC